MTKRTCRNHSPAFKANLGLAALKGEKTLADPAQPVANFTQADLARGKVHISVFPRPEILAPDDVRGDFDTLPEAIRARGWPRLDDVRGRVMLALDNTDAVRDAYIGGADA